MQLWDFKPGMLVEYNTYQWWKLHDEAAGMPLSSIWDVVKATPTKNGSLYSSIHREAITTLRCVVLETFITENHHMWIKLLSSDYGVIMHTGRNLDSVFKVIEELPDEA